MKTLSFHDLKVGRPNQNLLNMDTASQGISFQAGLNLIVAPNGYGKTTLLQTLAGVLKPQSGAFKIDDRTVRPEEDALYVSEYLSFPKFIKSSEWIEFIADQPWGSAIEGQLQLKVKGFRLEDKMQNFLGRLSQGERRKVTWLGAFCSKKPILLLDEPLDGLDLLSIECARQILREWKAQGKIVCLIAHQISELLDLSDQVFLIKDQKLIDWKTVNPTAASQLPVEKFRTSVLEFYG